MTTTVILENQSAITTDADLDSFIPAWMTFLNDHVRAFWPDIGYFSLMRGTYTPGDRWGMIFQDGIPIKTDLGYHDVESGMPVLRIDCAAARDDGYTVSEIGGHELGEAAVDPLCHTYAAGAWGTALVEICDMFIMPGMSYNINGVEVPNFSTPSFWHKGVAARLDMKGQLTAAFPTLPRGAYSMIIPPGQNAWQMSYATAPGMPKEEYALMQNRALRSARCNHVMTRYKG